MAEKVEGYLEVGTDGAGQVVVNHPDLQPDENGVGHIVFSPEQARNLARLLMSHAIVAEDELHPPQPDSDAAWGSTPWGRQQACPACGWMNLFIRNKCRNCGADLPEMQPCPPGEHKEQA